MNNKNSILIIMPVYNAADTLEDAIKSILEQSFKKIMLVIVDDASTDDSLLIAKKFVSDPRVIIYSNSQNMGAYYCRNFGLHASQEIPWTHFTTHDADDVSFKTRYKSILQLMDKDSKINAVQDMFDRINMQTGKTVSSKLTMAHAVFTRQVFDSIGYFDGVRFGGDWEHWARLRLYNEKTEAGTQKSLNKVNGESFIHDTNLTVIIPENSPKRMKYVERATQKMDKAFRTGKIKYEFVPERGVTRQVTA